MNLKKDTIVKIARHYANTEDTMDEIANYIKRNYNVKGFDAKKVSKCLYHSIFFKLVYKTEEEAIIKKISSNIGRHLNAEVRKKWKNEKYEILKKDRNDYEELQNSLKEVNSDLNKLKIIEDLKDELEAAIEISRSINDYISSEDERDYVPPRSIEAIKSDLNSAEESNNIALDKEYLLNLKKQILINLSVLERKYSI